MLQPQFLALAFALAVQDDPTLLPKLKECRLVVGAKELAPIFAESSEPSIDVVQDDWRLQFRDKSVYISRVGGREVPTKVDLPKLEQHSFWDVLAISAEIAYLTDPRAPAARVLRLDLQQHTLLPAWDLDDGQIGREARDGLKVQIAALTCLDQSVLVLRDDWSDGRKRPASRIGYLVARLDRASGKPAWIRYFDSEEASKDPGARLLAPMLVNPAESSVRPLQALGKDVLVCGGGSASVMRLKIVDGSTVWSVDRLWEYQRGYVGPSVWGHFLDRFATMAWTLEAREPMTKESREYHEATLREFAERKAASEAMYDGAIVGGPFILPGRDSAYDRGPRILVVVARLPRTDWPMQLTEQYVYELDASGTPCALVSLPREILGWTGMVRERRVVFACARGAWASVAESENTGASSMGMAGSQPDVIANLVWYSAPIPMDHAAWMSCDPAGDPVALDARLGVRPAGGGWIAKRGDTLFHFPLWLLDPQDGSVHEVELRVPFQGEMTRPSSNYRGTEDSLHTWGWRGLALTKIELEGERLQVWLANTKSVWRLEFDARELRPAK